MYRRGCTKTRNGEIRKGKWGNAEMGNGGQKRGCQEERRYSQAMAEAEEW